MYAVIMAGGKGTRMGNLTAEIPKPMLEIDGKPILEHQINILKQSGFNNIILIIGHLGEIIRDYFGDGSKLGVNIEYVVEEEPLGTAGGLYYLKDKLREDFVFIYGDIFLDINFSKMMIFHKENKSDLTMFVHPNTHPFDSDLVEINDLNEVTNINLAGDERKYYSNLVAAAVYISSPKIFDFVREKIKKSLEKDIIIGMIDKKYRVIAYKSTEYSKDMGTPTRYEQVFNDYKNGITASRNLKNKQRCIFIDRDGTINEHDGFLNDISKFKLIPKVAEGIKSINHSKYLAIVVTNQPVIARGELTFEGLKMIHQKMDTLLGEEGAYIDNLYFCPHHPHSGYEGEVKELKIECNCRKPATGMIDQAVRDYNIDVKESYMIGDTTQDIMLAKNAGLKSILVKTGDAGNDKGYDVKPDYIAENLYEAIKIILGDE